MNILDIIMVLAILDTGSMTRAAEKLGYTQSNLSLKITQLEKELECKFFVRLNHGILHTNSGQSVFPTPTLLEIEPKLRKIIRDWQSFLSIGDKKNEQQIFQNL